MGIVERFDASATHVDAAAPPKAPKKSRRLMSVPLGLGERHSTGTNNRSGSGLDLIRVRSGYLAVSAQFPVCQKTAKLKRPHLHRHHFVRARRLDLASERLNVGFLRKSDQSGSRRRAFKPIHQPVQPFLVDGSAGTPKDVGAYQRTAQ